MNNNQHASELRNDIVYYLNPYAWENRLGNRSLDEWLGNFQEEDRPLALFALHRFMYFGHQQVRQLLRIAYREHVISALVADARHRNPELDLVGVQDAVDSELRRTRFIGMGNPSESGCHLLYYFRQENELPTSLFIHSHEVTPTNEDVLRYIFIDDLSASGKQATRYSKDLLSKFSTDTRCLFWYIPLIATEKAKDKLSKTRFSRIAPVITLDETFCCFSSESRYQALAEKRNIDWSSAKLALSKYKGKLGDAPIRGFGKMELLLGFYYNIPNNTVPIFWKSTPEWTPVFSRYNKKARL